MIKTKQKEQLKYYKRLFTSIFILFLSIESNAQLTIASALCENKIDPDGISINNIHFSWELASRENDQAQTAYQIVVASSKDNLIASKYDIWNSNFIKSNQSILVGYKGKKLTSGNVYYWRVRVWDKFNKGSIWSKIQRFSTGLEEEKDWNNARWIGFEELADSMRVVPGVHAPYANTLGNKCMKRSVVPLFRKEFRVEKKIKNALLFITGLGQYEVAINGNKIGNACLAPGWTNFDKTVLYNCYDITNDLLKGSNVIGAIVGNGFYNINRERYFKLVTAYGFPTLRCRLKMIFEDGSQENVISDASWKTSSSPITFSSIYGGEDFDGRLIEAGWNKKSFDDSNWRNAVLVTGPKGKMIAEIDHPVAIMDSFTAKKVWQHLPGTYLYDFGQNASAVVSIKVKGKKGQTIKLIPSELLNSQHLANQGATGEPYYFSYTLKGDTVETWQPKFTYYGFRYVQVEGAVPDSAKNETGLPVLIEIKELHNRNSNPQNGSFQCSNDLFNRIDTLINWAIKSNMQSVLSDCPHREKLGWLEQDYLMGNSIHYNFDVYNLYRKIITDMMDAQYPEGFIPDITPEYVTFEGGFLDSPEWGSASVILPWMVYQWYGDVDIIGKAYPMMKKYVSYLESKSNNHILSHGLGDWFDYGPQRPGEAQLTPKDVTATSIYYYDVLLLYKMAQLLGRHEDELAYSNLAVEIKKSFNNKFYDSSKKSYSTGSQTAMAMPYCVGLVPENDKTSVLKNLVDSIYAGNKALTAGDIGFHFLVQALDAGGASQLIYDMNNRDDVPGYGFQLRKGATALTESWPALENVSNNHLMLGHIMEWFYNGLAGIGQEDNSIAFKHIKIRPQPVGNITSAKGTFHCPYGWIKTEWKMAGGKFSMSVTIPVNTDANVYIPMKATSKLYVNGQVMNISLESDAGKLSLGSGNYNIDVIE